MSRDPNNTVSRSRFTVPVENILPLGRAPLHRRALRVFQRHDGLVVCRGPAALSRDERRDLEQLQHKLGTD